jgi:hypothetical protein
MPEVSLYTAAMMVVEIGNVKRFGSPKRLSSFAGLVPSTCGVTCAQGMDPSPERALPGCAMMVSAVQKTPAKSPLQEFFEECKL